MSAPVSLILAVLVPVVGAAGIGLASRRPNLREGITFATASVLLLSVLALWPAVRAGGRPEVVLAQIAPGLSLALEAEPLGLLFAVVASFLWLVTSLYSVGYMRAHGERHQTRFYACFSLALGATMGVALAANVFTLFVFYEVLTLVTYPLVAHHDTCEARRAGRFYLLMLLGTSIALLLVAVVWTWVLAGTLEFTAGGVLRGRAPEGVIATLFALYVFGIAKSAIMPLHRWLPAAMVAPTPVSALLHAVAVVKAGVFSILKISTYVFGPELLAEVGAARAIAYLAGFTIIAAGVVALREDDLKRRLAYSTVSQLSYVVLGALLANTAGIVGAGLHIVMHAFGKITLFFCAGAIVVAAHKTAVSELAGLGRRMPITMGAFALGSLSVIGLPPAGGLWSKWHLGLGTLEAGEPLMLAVLVLGSLLSMGYLAPIIVQAFFRAPLDRCDPATLEEAPWPCVAAIVLVAAACVVLFFTPTAPYELMVQFAEEHMQ